MADAATATSGASVTASPATSVPPAGASQLTAANQTVEAANGVIYAYRRFGNADAGELPLVFLQHYSGNLDGWDPALVDPLAETREIILFDNAGVAGSSGAAPRTMVAMAHDALSFIDALELPEVDLFGYSIGGYIAQELVLIRPQLVRRIVLAGTAPEGGLDIHGFSAAVLPVTMSDDPGADGLLFLFFEKSEASIAKGKEFVGRIFTREADRDVDVTRATYEAQLDAFTAWGIPDRTRLNRLAGIRQPVLVANGDNDIMVPTPNSHLLAEHLPDARIEIYPDAGHGFLFQYPAEFAEKVNDFLAEGRPR
jgi:pimeloyl-ACP methyl ester carboxylesterase